VVSKKVLIVEDEVHTAQNIKLFLDLEGFETDIATDLKSATKKVKENYFPLVVLDLVLPDGHGLELLKYIDLKRSKVLVLTAFGDVGTAVKALKSGAYDFLEKPISLKELAKRLNRAFLELSPREEKETLDLSKVLIGNSSFTRELREKLPQLAKEEKNLLIRGEEGVGKTFVGELIHRLSPRREFPLKKLLVRGRRERAFELERELFGSEIPGKESVGILEQAKGGTVILIGIEDLPLQVQEKLNRALEERSFTPIGSNRKVFLDLRIVSTTTQNLYEMAQKGLFKGELLFKLNETELEIPPLRERREDILPLFDHFLTQFSEERGLEKPILSESVVEFLLSYPFPGNVMELKNTAERLVLLKPGQVVEIEDLGLAPSQSEKESLFKIQNWKKAKKLFEKEFLKRKLIEANGDVKKVAQMVNLDVSNVYRKIKAYNLEDYLKK